jgi:hypothetical protein
MGLDAIQREQLTVVQASLGVTFLNSNDFNAKPVTLLLIFPKPGLMI